jgi:hypothetical protein
MPVGAMALKFGFFHLMPYADYVDDSLTWPVPNRLMDPRRAQQLYAGGSSRG